MKFCHKREQDAWSVFQRHTNGGHGHGTMLNITSQGDADRNHMRYCLTPVRMASSTRQEITSAGKDVEKGA